MMAMRKSLRRGSAWVDHSIGFRARDSMLLAPEDWAGGKEQHLQILGLPPMARARRGHIGGGVCKSSSDLR